MQARRAFHGNGRPHVDAVCRRGLLSRNLEKRQRIMTSSLIPRRASRALTSFFGRDPFRALQAEMDDVLTRFSEVWTGDEGLMERVRIPSLDLSETDGEVQIKVDVPGMKPEEIDIEVTGNTVRISGQHTEEKKEDKEEKGRTYHRIERRSGSFSRSVELPCAVKEDKVSAEYKDGVLKMTLPKSEEAKTHKVTVKSNGK